jgi:6-pyruvoyltetrahydropterin/6-carboxytetrahydropterin synthase
VQAEGLNEIGVAYDFVELKRHLGEIVGQFDHVCLNDIPPFNRVNPSSENIAAAIYEEVQTKLKGAPVRLVSVEVWESPDSCATYTG